MSQAQLIPSADPIPSFPAIAYKGTPVLTTEMLAHAYGVDAVRIRQNFSRNAQRFTCGKHYFQLSGNELKGFKDCVSFSDAVVIPARTKNLTLWTDRGSARHAKMLESDKAWDVYEMLEDTFFAVPTLDKLAAEERAQLPADVNPSSLTPAQQSQLHAIVAAKVGMLPKEAHRKAYSEIWSRFGRHFQVAKYQQLCPSRMGEAVEYLVGVELKVAQKALPPATTVVPLPASNAMNEVEQRIIALHAHVVKERHTICRDMGLAVWQTYGGDVLASMFHAIYTCVDKAIIDPSASLSSFDLPVDLAQRIAGLKVSASGARI